MIKNMLFTDYAMYFIDETLNQIHVNSPTDYEKGMAGIGINYMIRNIFLGHSFTVKYKI